MGKIERAIGEWNLGKTYTDISPNQPLCLIRSRSSMPPYSSVLWLLPLVLFLSDFATFCSQVWNCAGKILDCPWRQNPRRNEDKASKSAPPSPCPPSLSPPFNSRYDPASLNSPNPPLSPITLLYLGWSPPVSCYRTWWSTTLQAAYTDKSSQITSYNQWMNDWIIAKLANQKCSEMTFFL